MDAPSWKKVRDVTLFVGGVAGIAYEALGGHTPRESLLVIYAAAAGLPAFLRTDEKKGGDDVKPSEPGKPVTTAHDHELAQAIIDLLGDRVDEVRRAAKATASAAKTHPRSAAWISGALVLAVAVQ